MQRKSSPSRLQAPAACTQGSASASAVVCLQCSVISRAASVQMAYKEKSMPLGVITGAFVPRSSPRAGLFFSFLFFSFLFFSVLCLQCSVPSPCGCRVVNG